MVEPKHLWALSFLSLKFTSQMVFQFMAISAQKPPSFQQIIVAGTEEFTEL